jgi:lactate 2-monooxygenase
MEPFGPRRQVEIYSRSPGSPEPLPIGFQEWEARARAILADGPFDYVAGGAGREDTMRANREAFERRRIHPRMLRDVAERDLTIELFGVHVPAPIILAPVGVQSIIHPQAERAPARAAASSGIPFTLSTVSSVTIEQIAAEMGTALRWFQLYPGRDRAVMNSLVSRAEAAGYRCLILTVDTTMLGWRERDLRKSYLPFMHGEGMANYLSDPVFRSQLSSPPEVDPRSAVLHFLDIYVNPSFTWDDVDFLRTQTRMPIVLKGILHPDDAREALTHGIDGIVVSNHGGRQVDGGVATLDVLPAVCAAVGDRVPVLMDSGIRSGADVVKALALGARAVLIGRPYLYALAAAGEDGVRAVIRNLLAELDLQLALSGCSSLAGIGPDLLWQSQAHSLDVR